MTAVAAITTGKFTVIVSDTMFGYETIVRYGPKLLQGENLVYGGAGEVGPLWRNIRADKSWMNMKTVESAYLRTLTFHKNIITDKQLDAAIHGADACVEELLIASKEKIMVVDNYGAELPAQPLDEGRAFIEVCGVGRSYILGYIHGSIAPLEPAERRKIWRSASAIQKLLVAAQEECAKHVPGVGGKLDIIILR